MLRGASPQPVQLQQGWNLPGWQPCQTETGDRTFCAAALLAHVLVSAPSPPTERLRELQLPISDLTCLASLRHAVTPLQAITLDQSTAHCCTAPEARLCHRQPTTHPQPQPAACSAHPLTNDINVRQPGTTQSGMPLSERQSLSQNTFCQHHHLAPRTAVQSAWFPHSSMHPKQQPPHFWPPSSTHCWLMLSR
jgi:hypothetical protein